VDKKVHISRLPVETTQPHYTLQYELWYNKNADTTFFRFVTNHAFDRQTDRETEFSSLDRVCVLCSAVKRPNICKPTAHDAVKTNRVQRTILRWVSNVNGVTGIVSIGPAYICKCINTKCALLVCTKLRMLHDTIRCSIRSQQYDYYHNSTIRNLA